MTDLASCLYLGEVIHRRFAPRPHRLHYRMFQMLFDLDELPDLSARLRLFSHNAFNVLSFHDADHGDRRGGPLRAYVEDILAPAGISLDGGKISLLCMPRIFGHVFNPLSVYYCHGPDGRLVATIYEVNNTFGQRHSYIIPATADHDGIVRNHCRKRFYVSPFMDMNMTYDFKLLTPRETIATIINGSDAGGARMIFAAFTGVRRGLSDKALLSALFAYPFLTIGVVLAIHWEAVKLIAKGLRIRARPPPPAGPVTVAPPTPSLAVHIP